MLICKECGKSVAVLAFGISPHGKFIFDFCDECFEKIYNEIFMEDEEEEDDDEFTL